MFQLTTYAQTDQRVPCDQLTWTWEYDGPVPLSDWSCNQGALTTLYDINSTSPNWGTASMTKTNNNSSSGRYITVNFNPNFAGSVTFEVRVSRRIKKWDGCYGEDKGVQKTFTLTKESYTKFEPIPTFSIPTQVNVNQPFNISFNTGVSVSTTYLAIYDNTNTLIQSTTASSGSKLYQNQSINIGQKLTKAGNYTYTFVASNACGKSSSVTQTINVLPNCSSDSAASYVLKDSLNNNLTELKFPANSFSVSKGSYSLKFSGITDMSSKYNIYSTNPLDVLITGSSTNGLYNIKIVNPAIASYSISITNKNGSSCQAIYPIKLFVNGKDKVYPSDSTSEPCIIVLPDYLINKFKAPYISVFAATFKSQKAVIVKPGYRLVRGAHLKIEISSNDSIAALDDENHNWYETTSYDEYGNVISSARAYFDELGSGIQTQVKNISRGVILTNQNIYDIQGRQAISTLPAPTAYRTSTINACGDNALPWENLDFKYRNNFVTNKHGQEYSYLDFDNIDNDSTKQFEKAPKEVGTDSLYTLGWYYSENNVKCDTCANASIREPNTPVTKYPYTRSYYQKDGSNLLLGSTLPGDYHYLGSGHTSKDSIITFNSVSSESIHKNILGRYINIRNNLVFPQEENLTLSDLNSNVYIASKKDGEKVYNSQNILIDNETFTYFDKSDKPLAEYHVPSKTTSYTYYNLKGLPIVTISPNGVKALNQGMDYDSIDKTINEYDFKGRLVKTTSKDAGTTHFIYRKDDKIRFTQNAEQAKTFSFSYVNYDILGRIIEAGVYKPKAPTTSRLNAETTRPIFYPLATYLNPDTTNTYLVHRVEQNFAYPTISSDGQIIEVIKTFYDLPLDDSLNQQFIAGKVSYTTKDNGYLTIYSYNDRGQITWTLQKIPGLGYKRIDYKYTPTGQVKEVAYQRNDSTDRFTHYYEYDADNRLSNVYTSFKAIPIYNNDEEIGNLNQFDKQASYDYYLHGPLKTKTLGSQTQEMVYTIQGWLKAINNPYVVNDNGFNMVIDYFSGDYIKGNSTLSTYKNTTNNYTGLISGTVWASDSKYLEGYEYTYNNKYQYIAANYKANLNKTNQYLDTTLVAQTSFREDSITYDLNGNILGLRRTDYQGHALHSFVGKYNYKSNSNQLSSLTSYNNYTYNSIGQTITETPNNVYNPRTKNYIYNANNLLKEVFDTNSSYKIPIANFDYNEAGYRFKKQGFSNGNPTPNYEEFYVNDYSGNVLAIYQNPDYNIGKKPLLSEIHVYGTGRIGVVNINPSLNSQDITIELKDNLGNIRSLFSEDMSLHRSSGGYSLSNYYPYGLPLNYNTFGGNNNNRYGYQGNFAEKDQETGFNSFLLRNYDPIRCQWTTTDPKHQYFSPFLAMGNNPVSTVDPDGGFDPPIEDASIFVEGTVRKSTNFDIYEDYKVVDNKWVGNNRYAAGFGYNGPHYYSKMDVKVKWDWYLSNSLATTEEALFSKQFGTWMGKDLKFRFQSWGGNGATGGKFSFAKNWSTKVGYGGKLLGGYGIYDTYMSYRGGEIDNQTMYAKQLFNGTTLLLPPAYSISAAIGDQIGSHYPNETYSAGFNVMKPVFNFLGIPGSNKR